MSGTAKGRQREEGGPKREKRERNGKEETFE